MRLALAMLLPALLLAMPTQAVAQTTTLSPHPALRQQPVTVRIEPGSELTNCRNVTTPQTRCLLLDATREDDVRASYIAQFQRAGWRSTETRTDQRATVEFRRDTAGDACPFSVTMSSGFFEESHFRRGPIPPNKVFYLMSYTYDVDCELRRAP